jgi:hypothetical protein
MVERLFVLMTVSQDRLCYLLLRLRHQDFTKGVNAIAGWSLEES